MESGSSTRNTPRHLLTKFSSMLEQSGLRYKIYSATAVFFVLLAFGFVYLKGSFNFVVSDGRGYFAYLPSIVIDHDLSFENQVREHWDVDFVPALLEDRTPTGYVRNKYPAGFAMSMLPSFTLAHISSTLLYKVTGVSAFEPHGYSFIYQLSTLLNIVLFGLLMMFMLDKILVGIFSIGGGATFLSIMSFWTLTNYSYYYFREPVMVHVTSAFWVTACVYFGLRFVLGDSPKRRDFLVMATSFGFAIVCRPTNFFMLPFLTIIFMKRWSEIFTQSKLTQYVAFGFLAFLPVAAQMFIWKELNGSWISYSYNDEGFVFWRNPFLLSTLFSSKHGLFFWSPVLILALAGWLIQIGSKRVIAQDLMYGLMLGALMLWYLNSSWHQWWFGDAFGGRSFIELAPVFVLGFAFFFQRILMQQKHSLKVITAGFLMLTAIQNYGMIALYILHKIPRADYLF